MSDSIRVEVMLADIPATSTGPLMSDIIAEARSFLDELDAGRLEDAPTGKFGLLKCCQEAYVEYSKRTRCFRDSFDLTTEADKALYTFANLDVNGRLFEIDYAAYADEELSIRTVPFMDSKHRGWRKSSSGTPTILIPWGEAGLRLWYPPDDEQTLDVDGFVTADLATFADPTHKADVPTSRQTLLAAGTAVIAAIRLLGVPEAQLQQQMCGSIWESGIKDAKREIDGFSVEDEVIGRSRRVARYVDQPTITEA